MQNPMDTGDVAHVDDPHDRLDVDPAPGERGYAEHVALGDDGNDDTAGLDDLPDGDVVDEGELQ